MFALLSACVDPVELDLHVRPAAPHTPRQMDVRVDRFAFLVGPDGWDWDLRHDSALPRQPGWWRISNRGTAWRELDDSLLDLRNPGTFGRIRLRWADHDVDAVVRAHLPTPGVNGECMEWGHECPVEGPFQLAFCDLEIGRVWGMDLLPCLTHVLVTTTSLQPADFHRGAVASPPSAETPLAGHFYVASDGAIELGLPTEVTPKPGDADAHVVHIVVQTGDGKVNERASSTLTELLDLLLDRASKLPRALGTRDGIELSTTIERRAVCETLYREGHAIRGCAEAVAPSTEFCGRTPTPNTTEMACHDPTVVDLRPLVHLPHLRMLDLSGTSVSDITPLGALERVEFVNLADTKVEDLRPLLKTPLRVLDIRRTEVEAIWPLRHLSKLETVTLTGAPVALNDRELLAKHRPSLEIKR